MRKFRTHPAYHPVKLVNEFKYRTRYVVTDFDTGLVYWSAETEDEADCFASTIADTLETSTSVFEVKVAL